MSFRKYLQKFFFNSLFLIIISFTFQSCSLQENISESQKLKEKFQKAKIRKDRKSNSNFFAYYNSYYLAKVKFRDALELSYQEEVSGNQRNSKASSEKLFDDAIKYSLIVINDFENSLSEDYSRFYHQIIELSLLESTQNEFNDAFEFCVKILNKQRYKIAAATFSESQGSDYPSEEQINQINQINQKIRDS